MSEMPRVPRAAAIVVLCAALARLAGGQGSAELSLAGALADKNGDFVPDRLGDTIVVIGTVTTTELEGRGGRRYVMIQGGHDAVRLRSPRDSAFFMGLRPGSIVRVRGVVRHVRGNDELRVLHIEHLGLGEVPKPRPALVVDLLNERYVGERVLVSGEWRTTVVTDTADASDRDREFEIHDRSGVIRVRLPDGFMDSDSAAALLRSGPVELVALLTQSDGDAPFDSGYRLEVSDLGEVHFVQQPRYAVAGTLAVLAGLLMIALYSYRRRRSAERRTAEAENLLAELKRSDAALRESLEWNQRTFDSAAVGMAHVAVDGRWLRANPTFCAMLGYTESELLASTAAAVTYPDDAESHADQRQALWEGRIRSYTREKRYVRKDGRVVWAEVTAAMMGESENAGTPDGWHFIVVVSDISHKKQLEAQLRQSQKMEAVGQLAGGVAHDFNNLLTVIGNYTAMLLQQQDPSSPAAADLREVASAADRAAQLTRQLLAFSRKQLLQPRIIDLNEVAFGLAPMLRRLIGEDIRIATSVDPRLGLTLADPGQIEQVIVNLAVNARDAMPGGGTLTIETANVELGGGGTHEYRTDVLPGPYVMLAISDTGCGMDADTRARIFEPFFTTKDPGKGTGLGLATAYGIIKQSGGFISVYSEIGLGTTFKIYLPQAEPAAVEQSAGAADEDPPGGSEIVLLVEDDDSVRTLARRVLAGAGYTVLEARNGVEAMRIATVPGCMLDVVLTDVVMPEMGGTELASGLREVHPELPIVFMSGYTDDDIVRRGLLDPDMAFIQKPFTTLGLCRVVRTTLDQMSAVAAP
jgi:two-component system cell cycle sensor histidine kinase/response regulator CckA